MGTRQSIDVCALRLGFAAFPFTQSKKGADAGAAGSWHRRSSSSFAPSLLSELRCFIVHSSSGRRPPAGTAAAGSTHQRAENGAGGLASRFVPVGSIPAQRPRPGCVNPKGPHAPVDLLLLLVVSPSVVGRLSRSSSGRATWPPVLESGEMRERCPKAHIRPTRPSPRTPQGASDRAGAGEGCSNSSRPVC